METTSLELILDAKEFEQLQAISLDKAEQFKSSFKHYIPEIVEEIEKTISEGIYPYNSVIAERCSGLIEDKKVLNHFVYTSQDYLHKKSSYQKVNEFKEIYKDWKELSNDEIKKYSDKKQYFQVVGLNVEPFKARPFIDAEGKLFWMPPRYSRRGFRLNMARVKI